ncbi:MAG TPA: hypothetical protein VFN67_28800 [Polyangiales bacterium]|nr:hypothetical protein [Polyangiales bacterium]
MYDYNTLGLLTLSQDALGGYHRYDVTRTTNMQTVTDTTGLGRVTSYAYTRNNDRTSTFRITFPTGTQNVRNVDANGVSTTTFSDGTVNTSTLVPDPTLGAQSLLANETTTTPGGRTRTINVTRSVAQTSPTNPLSLTTLTETTTDNGRVSTRAFTKSNRTWTGTSPASRVATIQLDGQGRVIKSSTTGTLPIEMDYDSSGRLTRVDQPLSSSVTERFSNFAYDASSGYLDSQTNALTHVTSYENDAVGRVEHVLRADGSDTGFGYDAESRISSVTPAQRSAHSLTYTPVDLPKDYIAPQVGASPTITTLDYDLDRALKNITQPDGQQQTFVYDPSKGRLQSATIPGAGNTTYGYDAQSRLQSVSNDAAQGSMTYGYDGSLVTAVTTTGTQSVKDGSTTLWSGGLRGSVIYGYNNQHDVSSISVQGAAGAPNGFAATIGRDNDDLVTSIAPTGGGSVPTITLTRSPLDGHVVSSTQGAVTTEYAMDISTAAPGYGELQGISNPVNGSEIYGVT